MDAQVVSLSNIAEIISFEALRLPNSLRSLKRWDKPAIGPEAVSTKVLDIAFTSLSLRLSRTIR